MIDFLIKLTITLFVLLAVYYLFLEKEKMHLFNRFYLLFSLVFSFVVPFITIEVIQEIAKSTAVPANIQVLQGSTQIVEETNYLPIALWSLYALVTLILAIRFISNVIKISAKMKSNSPIAYKNAKLILVPEKTLPHTFLNSIFINETDYNNRNIEAELYTHELTHVTQKHTLDILFIEIIKTIFWFNPIFIFYKKAIQLNHEFLADEKVVTSYKNVPFYQSLLLSKANENQPFYLASNLNYLITKKRLLMMTKTTSTTRALVKKGLLIPLLTVLVFSLCTKVVAQEKKVVKAEQTKTQLTGMEKYFENTIFKIKDKNGTIVSEKKFNELTNLEKKNVPPPPPPATSKQDKNLKEAKGPTSVELSIYNKGDDKAYKVQDAKTVSPEKVRTNQSQTVYDIAGLTEKPEFPGGIVEFYKFVGENFQISKEASANKIKGKVYITFIVEKDGSITDTKILRDIGFNTGEEAERVIRLSPKWIPGKMNEEPVRTMYSLPITVQTAK
ncbi:hypothetical protein H4V97_001720 [Flavobacterium sp. CG_23.5]|uniref:energy transducer TonB n=1 Tax=Flavobacterium sp. CG_23.5 TaxID=2760708 RepID=UPI001AEAAE0A|nr:energy transducer TonB [Flavobacterium sp. CG_23.5]MBP2283402.1 hypothetical protein [Flavobacterium sp. CG_23.5]